MEDPEKTSTYQVTIISALLVAITIALAVEHPEWSQSIYGNICRGKLISPD
jgi:hypothetical protein